MRYDRRWLDWDMWYGREVEGRLSGTPTLFIGPKAELSSVLAEAASERVYINGSWIDKWGWSGVRAVIEKADQVTLALSLQLAERIPQHIAERCHIVLALTVPDLPWMKAGDEVRLDLAECKTRSWRWGMGWPTEPADYEGDRRVHDQ